MTLPASEICRRIAQLHAMMGSSAEAEAETARRKLVELLAKHGCTWNDLPDILAAVGDPAPHSNGGSSTTPPTDDPIEAAVKEAEANGINLLDLTVRLIEKHVAVSVQEQMAIALWIMHTFVYEQFSQTPRLAILSPVRGCGKSVLLKLIALLAAEPFRSDNVSTAVIYHHLESRRRCTLLLDEGDNQNIFGDATLRSVFNSGYGHGGNISRVIGGRVKVFHTFAPLAVAAIGTLPLPLLHRALIIDMQRRAATAGIERLDDANPPRAFAVARRMIEKQAATWNLSPDPEMPPQLRDRAADKWRPLLSIADALGRGNEARAAAVALSGNPPDEDAGVRLLTDIREIFGALSSSCRWGRDRISRDGLIEKLVARDDGFWAEWRGKDDNRPPHKLTGSELAELLRPFGIRSRTIWPGKRRQGDKSARGFLRSQFAEPWARYCPMDATPAQPNKIIHLPRKRAATG